MIGVEIGEATSELCEEALCAHRGLPEAIRLAVKSNTKPAIRRGLLLIAIKIVHLLCGSASSQNLRLTQS